MKKILSLFTILAIGCGLEAKTTTLRTPTPVEQAKLKAAARVRYEVTCPIGLSSVIKVDTITVPSGTTPIYNSDRVAFFNNSFLPLHQYSPTCFVKAI